MQMQILDSGPSPLSLRGYDAATPARARAFGRARCRLRTHVATCLPRLASPARLPDTRSSGILRP